MPRQIRWLLKWLKYIALTAWRSFSAYAALLTVIGYFRTNNKQFEEFVNTVISQLKLADISIWCHVGVILSIFIIVFVGRKNIDCVNSKMRLCKKLDTGDILYYFQDNQRLESGSYIQIMKIENASATPYAIGVVDSNDEYNRKQMKVKHYKFYDKNLEASGQKPCVLKEDCYRFFYYPHLRNMI